MTSSIHNKTENGLTSETHVIGPDASLYLISVLEIGPYAFDIGTNAARKGSNLMLIAFLEIVIFRYQLLC